MGDNLNLAIALLANLHRIAEISNAVVDFDLVVQKLFKGGDIEDLVRCRLGCVDDVLYCFFKNKHAQLGQPKEKETFFFLEGGGCLLLLACCLCLLGLGGEGRWILAFCSCETKAPPLGRNYSKGQELNVGDNRDCNKCWGGGRWGGGEGCLGIGPTDIPSW